jgi:hypothetical protein
MLLRIDAGNTLFIYNLADVAGALAEIAGVY